MKKGRTVNQERVSDPSFIGRQLTEDEELLRRKVIDYDSVKWPELNPIDMTVTQRGKQIKLATFRFPAATEERKGIVYYANGFNDFSIRYAIMAQ